MWGSAFVGDTYDVPIHFSDEFSNMVVKALSQHPHFSYENLPVELSSTLMIKEDLKKYSFAKNGDGWLESTWGKSANDIIRECRKARRNDKANKHLYDSIITDVRMLKAMEVEATIKQLTWANGLDEVIKSLGLDDKLLKALRKFGESRSVSLQKACQQFLKANTVLNLLNDKVDWTPEDQEEWVNAHQLQKDAKKMWRNVLKQTDNLPHVDVQALEFASDILEKEGPLSSRELVRRGVGHLEKNMTVNKMASLLKLYGEEYDVYKATSRSTYLKFGSHGLIIKDIWGYMAGSLDSDGSIFISERGDPRVTFVASGNMGKQLCEDLQKAVGCGRLVTDQKVAKNTQKSIHRLIFSAKDDIRHVLKHSMPHMRLKDLQAKAMLAYVDEKDKLRKNELYQLVTFTNWKDHQTKSESLLNKWGVDVDTIGGYAEGL